MIFKRFFLNLKGLSDGEAVSKKEYDPEIFMKSLILISDEWFYAIC